MRKDYGRTTITVPFDLKARMKKARAMVNWSAVACEAFERKLEELGPIEEITSVEDALKRMKSVQDLPSKSDLVEPNETGREAGKHWAMNFAKPDQLKRIEGFRAAHPNDEWNELMTSREGWMKLANCIDDPSRPMLGRRGQPGIHEDTTFEDIRPGRHRRRRRFEPGPGGPMPGGPKPNREKEIWRSILDRRPDHPGFFLGFAEGALEVWDQLKDQF